MVPDRLEAALRAIAGTLAELDVRVALVGGLAVSARCEPRLTRDVDLAVAVGSDEEAERLIRALDRRGWSLLAIVEQQRAGRLATARIASAPYRGVVVDLLFASAGVEGEIVRDATVLEVLGGLQLPVASCGHLVAMKLLARDDRARPQDADDLVALREVMGPEEVARAREAVGQIVERGYARGRDLIAQFAAWRAG